MKNDQQISDEIIDAMSDFANHLPDADKSFHSTIIDEIHVEQKKIILMAQKRKGNNGMCWDIRYKATTADQAAARNE
jgi:hypothetical protein